MVFRWEQMSPKHVSESTATRVYAGNSCLTKHGPLAYLAAALLWLTQTSHIVANWISKLSKWNHSKHKHLPSPLVYNVSIWRVVCDVPGRIHLNFQWEAEFVKGENIGQLDTLNDFMVARTNNFSILKSSFVCTWLLISFWSMVHTAYSVQREKPRIKG